MTQPSNRTTKTPHNAARNHATHAPVVVSVDTRPLPKAVHATQASQPAVPTIAMVLGGGRGLRRIDPDQSQPLALMPLGDGQAENGLAWASDDTGLAAGGRVLDWVLHALGERGIGRSSVRFVGGYHVQKVLAHCPGLRFCFDGQWPAHGPVQALAVGLAAEWGEGGSGNASDNRDAKLLPAMVVAETAGVFRASAVATLEQAGLDIALACVPVERSHVPASRNKQTPVESGGPVPLVWLSPKAVAVLLNHRHTLADLPVDMNWSAWANWLVACGEQANVSLTSGAVPTDAAAVLSDASGLAKFVFGTKAMTLARLQPLVKQSVVLDQVAFTVAEWAADRVGCIQRIQQKLGDGLQVVRSSAVQEDGWHASAAGQYDSVLDVPATNDQLVGEAVDRVVSAYGRKGHDPKLVADCQVLVQPQLVDVLASGVVLTADAKTNAPQRTISVDWTSGRTDSVTAGDDHRVQNLVVRRGKRSARLLQTVPWLGGLLDAIDELEALVGHDRLDIEFAVGPGLDAGDGERHLIHVLQVRPLAGGSAGEAAKDHVSQADVDEQLDAVAAHLQRLASQSNQRLPGNPSKAPIAKKAPLPGVPGAGVVLGNMPDWNPAEMVGTAPRGLALSLYQTLITDGVWAEARAQMGHRDVTGTPLLVALAGQPYIDVKASFASFLPAGLDESIAEKAVAGALQRLAEHPEWHDKVEFAVMPTCAHADKAGFELRCKQLGLDASETAAWWDALAKHLKELVGGEAGNMDQTMAEQDRLQNVLDAWAWTREWEQTENNGGNGGEPVGLEDHAQALWQLHRACQAFGTLPFAKMARHGFVAVTLLQSLVAVGAFAEKEASAFCRSLPTVAGDMAELLAAVKRGEVDKQTFVQSHGHLRPGTYDLLSPSYRETVDQLLAVTTGMDGAASGGEAGNTAKDAFRGGIASGTSGGGELVSMDAALQRALGEHAPSAQAVLAYIAQAIPGREKAKFVFTKAVDAMLGHVAAMGALLGMDKALACELPVSAYLRLATDPPTPDVVKELQRRAGGLAKKHRVTRAVRLPALIVSPEDVAGFAMLDAQPNFITRQSVTADVVVLSENQGPQNVSGKIVVIENADPGFDWLFAAGIAGLVTKHGGAASHMAIRATEFDLPAAIGCGALVHAKAARAKRLMLDCSSHRMWGMDANGHWPVHGGDVTGLV